MKSDMDEIKQRMSEMESKLQQEQELKCKYFEAMARNDDWEYSAEVPDIDYWTDRGFDMEGAELQHDFLEDLKADTTSLRWGKHTSRLSSYKRDTSENFQIALHDESMLPHWREFAAAIEQYQHTLRYIPQTSLPDDLEISECDGWEGGSLDCRLSLVRVELPREVRDILTPVLKNTHFMQLDLSGNNFGEDGVRFAIQCLESNPMLTNFSWNSNCISSRRSLDTLSRAIHDHPSLENITLRRVVRGLDGEQNTEIDGHDVLETIIHGDKSRTFKRIGLQSNDVYSRGNALLSDFLATNPKLRVLDLYWSLLNDTDAPLLANALRRNSNLEHLNLQASLISEESGYPCLEWAVFDRESLNSVSDSNHSCHLVLDIDDPTLCGVVNTWGSPKQNRSYKIYSMLASRNRERSNVEHLHSECAVSIQLLPDILVSVQSYNEYHIGSSKGRARDSVEPLSIVYEMMRGWGIESVYEFTADVSRSAKRQKI